MVRKTEMLQLQYASKVFLPKKLNLVSGEGTYKLNVFNVVSENSQTPLNFMNEKL